MKFNYSFSLPQQPPPAKTKPPEALVEFAYDEFMLALPAHWQQIPTSTENSFNFSSDVDGASITISADFYEIPEEKMQPLAEKCLASRLDALERVSPGRVNMLNKSIEPYSGGGALEMLFDAEIAGESVYLYLGYVSSRKIFNFTLVCGPDKYAAGALFNRIMPHLRVKLP